MNQLLTDKFWILMDMTQLEITKKILKKTYTRAKLYKRTHSLNQNQAVRQTTAPQYGASRG